MECLVCGATFEKSDVATQVYRRGGVVVTVTGIPAESVCPNCGNAVLDWDVAQQVEDLVQPLFVWAESHSLPKPVVSITFPEPLAMAA